MNTKFQLLIIVIVALFSLSSSITIAVSLATEPSMSRVYTKSAKESRVGSQESQSNNQSTPTIPVAPISDEVADFKGLNGDDDGVEHHFHFGRVRKCRRYAQVFCIVAKAVLILSHFALLVFCYCHLVHH